MGCDLVLFCNKDVEIKPGCKSMLVLAQPYPRQSGVDSQNNNLLLSLWGKDKDKEGKKVVWVESRNMQLGTWKEKEVVNRLN